MKKILLLLLTIMLLDSCSKNTDTNEEQNTERVLGNSGLIIIDASPLVFGRWKLDSIVDFSQLYIVRNDYTLDSIIYEFKPYSVLSVSGETNHLNLYQGLELGPHAYVLETSAFKYSPVKMTQMIIDGVAYLFREFDNMQKIQLLIPINDYYRVYHLVKIE